MRTMHWTWEELEATPTFVVNRIWAVLQAEEQARRERERLNNAPKIVTASH